MCNNNYQYYHYYHILIIISSLLPLYSLSCYVSFDYYIDNDKNDSNDNDNDGNYTKDKNTFVTKRETKCEFYPFSFRPRREGQTGVTNRQKYLRNQSRLISASVCPDHSFLTKHTTKPNVTQTHLRCYSKVFFFCTLLQHHS